MTHPDELAICKRRGHEAPHGGPYWSQCKWCGTWVRSITTFQEREDEPPEAEQYPLAKLRRTPGQP
jgi:hypothetical protein